MDSMQEFLESKGKHQRVQQEWWYIWCILPNGRIFVDGKYATEQEALHFGSGKIKQMFYTVSLPTADISAATNMIKHRYLEQTSELGLATQNAKHQYKI